MFKPLYSRYNQTVSSVAVSLWPSAARNDCFQVLAEITGGAVAGALAGVRRFTSNNEGQPL
ncbi:hypothetical protein R950_001771 [Salmonella enterica subsp. enterica]|nr:hypothetical protein [Salmonella enterica subsp. enterica serovar Bijlmer]EBW5535775.1 hypothetical protein [Salmonella enterica subsp. enterica serovar Pasing]EBX5569143.1 hypothetical protein [Salmonella enterica subsp. enterica serovar Kuessel]ECI5564334.1 hypothetical protein [Salmonella enterica subsp. enterica]EDW1640646.1 hypothetical protein [Salmonella enterica subsp. enterica serovar Baguida]EDW2259828.1 hypothetical protein [Salmonella enterica subsp. enterica serovar Langford]